MALERITSTDRDALAFISRFPGADTEAVAAALTTQPSNLTKGKAATHPTVNVVSRRLAKLERMSCVQSWRNPAARVTHWGILEGGMDALAIFGQAPTQERGISGKRGLSLMHGRDVAHVAAQLMHREYVDKGVRGVISEPVPVENFVTDASMQSAMTTLRKSSAGGDWSLYSYARKAFSSTDPEEFSDPEFWQINPELLTFTAPASLSTKWATHRPDLVVCTPEGYRVALEIERNGKTKADYVDILRLYAHTLTAYTAADGTPVEPVSGLIYLCATDSIKKAVLTAASQVPGLENRLHVTDLTDAEGQLLRYGDIVPSAPTAPRPPVISGAPTAPTSSAASPIQAPTR